MLDRLLMSILRKDEDLRRKTVELENKFKLVERICYHRCSFYILGGRTGIQESRRIFLGETMETLQEMEQEWAERVRDFEKKVRMKKKHFIFLN